jgi:GT2 family glycosyltransferase
LTSGKFIHVDGRRFLIKGATYGTFAPRANGEQFPAREQVARDFALMSEAGLNTVRTYTVPPFWLLDEAAAHGLRVMAGIPWTQHVAFLDDRRLTRQIRRETAASVRAIAAHPATLLCALGNEIPPAVVRWHGQRRVERFLGELYGEAKSGAPDSLLTYVNFPPTEYLDLPAFDVCAFNVYLHHEPDLRAYLARVQHLAGHKPLLLAEAGVDSIREGADAQARITAAHIRTAFAEGACGAIAFAWTDEWWRGGHDVKDWAFGLVDEERRPKPALAAVRKTFAEAPFSQAEQAGWPKVSVVVCAYNAADTLADCLNSLAALTYRNTEVIVVNDGSRDDTSAIARRYAVRVIDVANGGLSAARNVGLAEATGEIVAYTDADVRVDPDWLTFLVQPMLSASFAGSGGPNVVPPDDPFVAQCVARAPGGPTQVLLDDRVAEHVPGCNMAFRRDALLSIGGFNPVYLRAGDDVDVCWRLQAKGFTIGFAPSALVWHHHRRTVRAYWRQQVGYGEGETWLDAHHPEKFIGGQMLWRGRIYSPLPFVRSLSGQRINTGVWGTAAFPGVYRTDVNPLQFLPHSATWMTASSLLCLAGLVALVTPYTLEALLLLSAGILGWTITTARCWLFAMRSDLSGMSAATTRFGRIRARAMIAWLHLVQPVGRFYGRVRGMWSPPHVLAPEHVTRVPWKAPVPSFSDTARSAVLLSGGSAHRSFWSEHWVSHSAILTEWAGELRAARPARPIDLDDGWQPTRDLSIAISRWGWLHVRALVEEHTGGRCLLRVETRMGPTFVGAVQTLLLAIVLVGVTSAAIALRWPSVSVVLVVAVAVVFLRAAWQTTRAAALLDQALERVTTAAAIAPLPVRPGAHARTRFRLRPATATQAAQAALVAVIIASGGVGGVSLVQDFVARRALAAERRAEMEQALANAVVAPSGGITVVSMGDVIVADATTGVIRRLRPRATGDALRAIDGRLGTGQRLIGEPVPFAGAADIAVAANGDMFVADPSNNRICFIDRPSGRTTTIAGSGAGGFNGDLQQAAQAALNGPSGLAIGATGDIEIADTLNNRVRVVVQATGVIKTVAGDGQPGGPNGLGDGGPAVRAHLLHPMGVVSAPNGDLYIADTGHHRVRKVSAATGIITTVAGTGERGVDGDGAPAVRARLTSPIGLALAWAPKGVTLYVSDARNGRVRVIEPDGTISTLGDRLRFVSPTRLSYHRGWVYVKDGSPAGLTAVSVSKPSRVDVAAAPRSVLPRKAT